MNIDRKIGEITFEGTVGELIRELQKIPADTIIIDDCDNGMVSLSIVESVQLNRIQNSKYEKEIQNLHKRANKFELKYPGISADRRSMEKKIQDKYLDNQEKRISLYLS